MKLRDKGYCPELVDDIECSVLFENRNSTFYCLGSLKKDKYIQLNDKNIDAVKKQQH